MPAATRPAARNREHHARAVRHPKGNRTTQGPIKGHPAARPVICIYGHTSRTATYAHAQPHICVQRNRTKNRDCKRRGRHPKRLVARWPPAACLQPWAQAIAVGFGVCIPTHNYAATGCRRIHKRLLTPRRINRQSLSVIHPNAAPAAVTCKRIRMCTISQPKPSTEASSTPGDRRLADTEMEP